MSNNKKDAVNENAKNQTAKALNTDTKKDNSSSDENNIWLKIEKLIADSTLGMANFFKSNEIARLSVILCLITSTTALLLGMVNEITSPIINERKMGAAKDAMMLVVPEATDFETMTIPAGSNALISDYYQALNGSNLVAYFVKVNPNGYGGTVELLVGLDANGAVISTDIIANAETPGIGDKAFEASHIEQFLGKSTALISVKSTAPAQNEISAVSGATVTSEAMTSGVSVAIEFIASNK